MITYSRIRHDSQDWQRPPAPGIHRGWWCTLDLGTLNPDTQTPAELGQAISSAVRQFCEATAGLLLDTVDAALLEAIDLTEDTIDLTEDTIDLDDCQGALDSLYDWGDMARVIVLVEILGDES